MVAQMVVQKAARMDAVSVDVMASAVAVTAAVADAAVAKAAAQKDVLKDVLKDAQKVVLRAALKDVAKAVAASAVNATPNRVLKACVRSVKTALLARCAAKRRVTTAVVTCKLVEMASHATTVALKTVSHASRVLTARALNALAANVATEQNVVIAVTAHRAMPQSKTLHLPTRPPWRQPRVAMALNKRKIVQPRTLAEMKVGVNVVTAMVAATIAVVNAPKATTWALKTMARSTLKWLHHP